MAERRWLFSAVAGSALLLFFPPVAGFCLFFNGVVAGEEDGELRKNDDGVGSAGAFVMENGSGSQLGRKRRWPPTGVLPLF